MDSCLKERLLELGGGGGGGVEWWCVGGNDCEGPKVSPFLKVWVTTVILPGTQTVFAHLFLSS